MQVLLLERVGVEPKRFVPLEINARAPRVVASEGNACNLFQGMPERDPEGASECSSILFGTAHTTDNPDALLAFEQVVSAIAAHRPIGNALQETFERDKGLVAAHAIAGIASVILGRSDMIAHAKRLLPAVETALDNRDGGTASERALVNALRLATQGQLRDGASLLDRHIGNCPRDFLCIKISHALRFMSGQASEMLALTRSVLPAWGPNDRAYGFLLGCHAFGLEERGLFTEAEKAGRDAYRHESADAWGLHAVSHVMEMERRTDEGIDWLEASRSDWRLCNNFSFHLAWHLALFLLEQGRLDEVLDLYDREIRPEPTDDFRDVAHRRKFAYPKQQGQSSEAYGVDHGSLVYLMGPDGKFLTFFPYGTPIEKMAATLKRYLEGNASSP